MKSASSKDVVAFEAIDRSTVDLPPVALALARVLIVGVHAVCLAYFFTAASVYRVLQPTATATILSSFSATVALPYFYPIAGTHYALAACHAYYLVKPCAAAVYGSVSTRWRWTPTRSSSTFFQSFPRTAERRVHHRVRHGFRFLYHHLCARRGLLGFDNPHFDAVVLVREIVETGLQSWQAYKMSRTLPRATLKWFYVATLTLNCCATPLLHALALRTPVRRLLHRVCDLVLDLLAAVGVPMILSLTYLHELDPYTHEIDLSRWDDETWATATLNEASLIFVSSCGDALARLFFSVGLLLSLRSIRGLLPPPSSGRVHPTRNVAEVRASNHGAQSPLRLAHGLLFLYGLAVLAVHAHSELRPRPQASCLPGIWPWLARKPICPFLEINCCTSKTLTGQASDTHAIFGALDVASLTQIRVRHCPHVEMDPLLGEFHNLRGVRFYNSTVVRWDGGAALTQEAHPVATSIAFVRTRFPDGTIPDGLLSPRFPTQPMLIEFSMTNIDRVPDDLHDKWPVGTWLVLEWSALREFPMTLAKAPFMWLHLSGNAIKTLPPEAFTASHTRGLCVDGNPIERLPETVDAATVKLLLISIVSTNVAFLPLWMDTAFFASESRTVVADATPLCARLQVNSTGSSSSSSAAVDQALRPYVDCSDTGGQIGVYQLDSEVRESETW